MRAAPPSCRTGSGNMAVERGEYDRAIPRYEESMALPRQVGDTLVK